MLRKSEQKIAHTIQALLVDFHIVVILLFANALTLF